MLYIIVLQEIDGSDYEEVDYCFSIEETLMVCEEYADIYQDEFIIGVIRVA